MRIRHILIITAIILSTAGISFADSVETTTLAIIADSASGLDESPLVALLEVELSQKEGIQLLERAEIDKILTEQQLSAAQLVDRETAIKIGKLLRADAIVIVSLENQSVSNTRNYPEGSIPNENTRTFISGSTLNINQPDTVLSSNTQTNISEDLVRVRVAETAHGLRLLDYFEQPDSANPQEAAQNVIKKIQEVLQKINQPAGEMIPIGIVDIHRVQLGEQYKMLERTLPKMLSVRLSLEPKIIMLEREDLKLLLDEKLMTGGDDSEFWSSAVLIDGYIQPNNGQLEIKLEIKQAAGDEILSCSVPVEPNEAIVAIDRAATEIIEKLQDSPPKGKWNPAQEAEQFYKQGNLLTKHGSYGEAMILFETAHALQPENVFYIGKIFELEWRMRDHLYWSSFLINIGYHYYTDIELAELASIFIRQIQDAYEKGKITVDQIYQICGKYLFDISRGYFSEPASVSSEKIKQLNQENRRIWIETFDKALKQQILIAYGFPINNISRASLAWISSNDPNEVINNLKKTIDEFIMPNGSVGQKLSTHERSYIYDQVLRNGAKTFLSKDMTGITSTRWNEFLKELITIEDPIIKFNACLDLGSLDKPHLSNQKETDEAKYYALKGLAILSEQLQKHNRQYNEYVHPMKKCLKELAISPFWQEGFAYELADIWTDVYEPLIDQKDALALALWDPGSQALGMVSSISSNEVKKHWYELLDKISEILKTQVSDSQVLSALNSLQDIQIEFRNKYPQLGFIKETLNIPKTMLLKKDDWIIPSKTSYKSFDMVMNSIIMNIKEEMLWVPFLSKADYQREGRNIISGSVNVCLAGIDLENGKLLSFWQADIPIPVYYSGAATPYITGIEVDSDIIYISVLDIGIVKFPGSLKKGRQVLQNIKVYNHETGLPSLRISSIAEYKDMLWVAYGGRDQESGLGIYEPKTGKWESVFCSILKGEEPFNSGYPYQIKNMKFIGENKLYFILFDPKMGTPNIGNWIGLWKMDVNNYETDYLKIGNTLPYSEGPMLKEAQNKWLIWTMRSKRIMEFDPVFETKKLLNWNPYADQYGTDNQFYSSAIYKDILWGRWGYNQIIKLPVGEDVLKATFFDNNILDGEPVWRFVSTPYGLVAIGEGTVGIIETEEIEE